MDGGHALGQFYMAVVVAQLVGLELAQAISQARFRAHGAVTWSISGALDDCPDRFYTARDAQRLAQINADTAKLQADLWSAVQAPAAMHPTPVVTLAVAGMNDVLNSQAYTQAAWWNRIPASAWGLMAAIAVACNVLIGYGARKAEAESKLLLVLPVLVAVSFLLIADIDSPRGGVIRVAPQNLDSLSLSPCGRNDRVHRGHRHDRSHEQGDKGDETISQ